MSVNSEICKARSLFITRGILNREIIPDVIVYSWVRSKLHNISVELLDIKVKDKVLDILSLDRQASNIIKYLRSIHPSDSIIYLSESNGEVLFNTERQILELPIFTNVSEESIGTNAGGISVVTGENVTVSGCEHYNKLLTNYISSSIIAESGLGKTKIVTLITPKRLILSHERLYSTLLEHFIKEEEPLAVLTENQVENDEIEYVNPIKTHIKNKEEKVEEISDKKDCKVFTLSIIEEQTIRDCLEHFNWNMKRSAEALGIGRSTLYRKLKEYKISNE